jgi:hypothetical protein
VSYAVLSHRRVSSCTWQLVVCCIARTDWNRKRGLDRTRIQRARSLTFSHLGQGTLHSGWHRKAFYLPICSPCCTILSCLIQAVVWLLGLWCIKRSPNTQQCPRAHPVQTASTRAGHACAHLPCTATFDVSISWRLP